MHDRQILERLWSDADLAYLLHSDQEKLALQYRASAARKFVANCSRRWGKSWFATVIAFEQCLSRPLSFVRYAAPTQKMVRNIIEPHIRTILNDCPKDLRPTYRQQDGVYHFPNGSEIHVAGTDSGNAEKLRGTSTHLAIVDEAGFVDDLEYLVQDVLLPQCLTVNGRILLISTPPRSPAHPFVRYCLDAELAGAYQRRTIYDAPHITEALIKEYQAESKGAESSTWRREYLAENVVDENSAVVPEFEREQASIVGEFELPEYYDAYIGADIGYYDLTVVLFAVSDFKNHKLLIVDEHVVARETSDRIASAVDVKRKAWWGDKEVRAVCDAPPIVIADLGKHGLTWALPRKDDAEAALNALRMAIGHHRIAIHPRCKHLISHLRNAIWNKSKTSFERSGECGHFDAVDALKYLWRTVDLKKNPYPRLAPHVTHAEFFIRPNTTPHPVQALFGKGKRND